MRTPGLGDRRLSSTSGVWPMACTMSPYLPPQGLLSRVGSVTSKSVARNTPVTLRASQPGDMMRKTLLAAGLALALVAAGCGTQSDTAPRTNYPPETRQNFIDNCVAASTKSGATTPDQARKTCTCVIDKLQ